MRRLISQYFEVEPHIKRVIGAEFFLQLINASFFILLNYYFIHRGYKDYEIAGFVAIRYMAVMFFAIPFGLFMKGKKLKPFILISCILLPLVSLAILQAVDSHSTPLLYALFACWGIAFSTIQISCLPYILNNSDKEKHSLSLALFFQTYAISFCLVGFTYYMLHQAVTDVPDLKFILQGICIIALFGVYLVSGIEVEEKLTMKVPLKNVISHYDWQKIFYAITPNFIIAVGAGLTIPFINLFFLQVHHINDESFALYGSFAYVLVSLGVLIIPIIKKNYGYEVAITLIQILGTGCLLLMATTEWIAGYTYAAGIAVFFFILRQPLMNVAGPMTSELTMYYVGRKNQEMISAINSAIWSGSWFISGSAFGILRKAGVSYSIIFFLTVGLYAIAIFWYYRLIKEYKKESNPGEETNKIDIY